MQLRILSVCAVAMPALLVGPPPKLAKTDVGEVVLVGSMAKEAVLARSAELQADLVHHHRREEGEGWTSGSSVWKEGRQDLPSLSAAARAAQAARVLVRLRKGGSSVHQRKDEVNAPG
jgi:hypothetical protein